MQIERVASCLRDYRLEKIKKIVIDLSRQSDGKMTLRECIREAVIFELPVKEIVDMSAMFGITIEEIIDFVALNFTYDAIKIKKLLKITLNEAILKVRGLL